MAEIELLAGQAQNGESDSAIIACNDWLRLGPGRQLVILHQKYTESYAGIPPTTALQTLKKWSSKFDWSSRATEFDAKWEEIKDRERAAVINFGLALDYERITRLKRLADFLEGQLYEKGEPDEITGNEPYHNLWLPDVKQIGSGEYAERVDIERFNAPLIGEFRATLDDIAKETGGRKQRTEISGDIGVGLNADTLAKLYNQRRSTQSDSTESESD